MGQQPSAGDQDIARVLIRAGCKAEAGVQLAAGLKGAHRSCHSRGRRLQATVALPVALFGAPVELVAVELEACSRWRPAPLMAAEDAGAAAGVCAAKLGSEKL